MRKNALGRAPARIAVVALVAAVVAPLGVSGPVNAADNGRGKLAVGHQKRLAKGLDGKSIGSSLNAKLNKNKPAKGEPGFDSSAFPRSGAVSVMLELDTAPAADSYAAALHRGKAAAQAAGRTQSSRVNTNARNVASHFGAKATKARTLFRTHALYSGIAVSTDASRLAALAKLPGVKAIHKLTPKSASNSTTVPLIGAPKTWEGRGNTGAGVRIGIIDTGVDYTHANFGGPGTAQAFADATASPTPINFDPAKFGGGTDFVGDAYDASSDVPAINTPVPDNNPIDCNGHGSHVSGTSAGFGVTAAGATFHGPYVTGLQPADFKIGPGVAPNAILFGLKVFGCDGSTNVVAEALDFAADPNGDGNLADHLDVVNMSLGSDFGSPQDPDSVASDNASKVGIIVAAAAGNGGDLYDVAGSPGNAKTVIGVAASDDPVDIVDGLLINSPAGTETAPAVDGNVDNIFPSEESVAFDWAHEPGVTNVQVVKIGNWALPPSLTNNTDGCNPLSPADAATVAGKIALLFWTDTDANRRCGSAGRSANIRVGGAVGGILGDDRNRFAAGITGDPIIPVMIVIKQGTDNINAQLDNAVPVFATLTNALHNTETINTPAAIDNIASFSSRGIGGPGNVKPDVAAPGVSVFSTAVGTGTEGLSESGTSMATPHIAGVAALVRAAHPTWTVEEVKAAIMDTATEDVTDGDNTAFANHTGAKTGHIYAPLRVGAGRVVANAAVDTQTLAFVKDDPGAVSVSFGPVAASAVTTLSKTIRVVSKRPVSSARYTVGFQAITSMPGVTYSVSPAGIQLAPGVPVDVKVTLTVNPTALRRTSDPTYDTSDLGGIVNNFYADSSGRVVFTPTGLTTGGSLRVPVFSAPRPASTMAGAANGVVSGTGVVRTGKLPLSGFGFDQGVSQQEYASTVSSFELQGSSPRKPDCSATLITGCTEFPDDRAGDLRYVGSASDGPAYTAAGFDPFIPDPAGDGTLAPALAYFGVATWGPWRTPASYSEYDVFIDANNNGVPDAAVFNTRLTGTDVFVAVTVNLATGATLDVELINLTDGSFDSNPYNSDVLAMPVTLAALAPLGLTGAPGHTRLSYSVEAFTGSSGFTDSLGEPTAFSADMKSPGLGAAGDFGAVLSDDQPGAGFALDLREDTSTFAVDKPLGLLLLHHFNKDGARAQVVNVKRATTIRIASNHPTAKFGTRPVVTATLTPAQVTGTVTFKEGSRVLGTVRVSGAKAALLLPVLARGNHTIVAIYSGDALHNPSTSPAIIQRIT